MDASSWEIPNLFQQLERAGDVSRAEMYRTFNMGVGMVVITDEASVPSIQASCASAHIATYRLGRIVRGTGQVIIS